MSLARLTLVQTPPTVNCDSETSPVGGRGPCALASVWPDTARALGHHVLDRTAQHTATR
jgi:hypothetical protein